MDKKLNFGGGTARLLDDPKGYVFSMITATYVWLDNLLYVEELAKRGQSGYTELYYEMLAEKLGPLLKGRLERSHHRRRQLLVHGLDGRRPAGAQVGLPGARPAPMILYGRVSPCATSADDRRGEVFPFRRGADRALPPEGQLRLGARSSAATGARSSTSRYKFTGRHDDAEDLTQEIFLKVFRSLEKFNRDADFSTWLSSVARNYCIDHYRASKREKEVLVEDLVAFDLAPASSGSSPHRALEDRDRRSFLRRGLEALPDKLREAVVLRDLQGLSYQEMADRLGLPEGTVKSRINRGREELSRLLLRAQQPRNGDGAGAAALPARR